MIGKAGHDFERRMFSVLMTVFFLGAQPVSAQIVSDPIVPRRNKLNEVKLTEDAPMRHAGAPTLKDLFPVVALNMTGAQPLSLEGMKLNGLGPRSIKILGFYHFVGLQATNFDTMAALYRDNRLANRSSFVTVDPFVHSYFALSNSLTVKAVEAKLYPELETLLKALIDSCVRDYRSCEIAEVKDDIQRNLAFAIVALKLLDPAVVLPDLGGASDLARLELAGCTRGGYGKSPIFNRMQDYDSFKPVGFWSQSPRTANYFKAFAWLSAMYFSLTDVTNNTEGGGGNTFRRAVLLYRSMELGRIVRPGGGISLMEALEQLIEVHNVVSQTSLNSENTVYLRDMRKMFENGRLEFRDLLNALAQPLSRARLLLSIKKQRPHGLTSTSIFELNRNRDKEENEMVLRFLPPINTYELEWLRNQSQNFKDEGDEGLVHPLSLYLLYSWGSPAASNRLNELTDRLDTGLMLTVPELTRVAGRNRTEADPHAAVCQAEKRWAVITEYFRPYKKGAQPNLNTEAWMDQRLLSASAAFVDSFCALDLGGDPLVSNDAVNSKSTGPVDVSKSNEPPPKLTTAQRMAALASGAGLPPGASPEARLAARKTSSFHYLDPCPELLRKISGLLSVQQAELTRLKCFPEELRGRCDDFIRLCDRLGHIADAELAVQPITSADFNLLANIDKILASLGSSTQCSVFMPGVKGGGVSLASGEPTAIYAIFNTDQGPYLSRGAGYSYYELSGGPFKKEHWARKKTYGFLRPPGWISRTDIISDSQSEVDSSQVVKPGVAGSATTTRSSSSPSPSSSQLKAPAR